MQIKDSNYWFKLPTQTKLLLKICNDDVNLLINCIYSHVTFDKIHNILNIYCREYNNDTDEYTAYATKIFNCYDNLFEFQSEKCKLFLITEERAESDVLVYIPLDKTHFNKINKNILFYDICHDYFNQGWCRCDVNDIEHMYIDKDGMVYINKGENVYINFKNVVG